MDTIQGWLIVGVPALVLIAGLFAGRSLVRSAFGYLVLALTFIFFLIVVEDTASAAVLGSIAFLLVASGRGDPRTEEEPYGHDVPFRVDDPEIEEPERV